MTLQTNKHKPPREERATMTKDELLRAVWLLDDVIESMRWIPVSERLPSREVLACNNRGYELIGRVFYDERSSTFYSAKSDHEHMYDVTAWRPRPEPYIPEK